MDFDVQRDVYDKIMRGKTLNKNYMFDLDKHLHNSKGERIEPEELTPEQKAEITLKNHVYELVFQDIQNSQVTKYNKEIDDAIN